MTDSVHNMALKTLIVLFTQRYIMLHSEAFSSPTLYGASVMYSVHRQVSASYLHHMFQVWQDFNEDFIIAN